LFKCVFSKFYSNDLVLIFARKKKQTFVEQEQLKVWKTCGETNKQTNKQTNKNLNKQKIYRVILFQSQLAIYFWLMADMVVFRLGPIS